jgi:protein-S-isoprenylcysteine O-methyltransferase Ste14
MHGLHVGDENIARDASCDPTQSAWVHPPAPSERGARVRFPPPVVFLAALVAGGSLQAGTPLQLPIESRIRIALGCILLLGGLALVASARLLFRRTGQSPVPWKPTPALIANGPYRFTRNPMYVGVTVFEIGLGIALDDAWISLLALAALVAVHFIAVRPEEAYLLEKFGEGYASYRRRVRRYL